MQKITLLLLLVLLPNIANAKPYGYLGIGSVVGNEGSAKTVVVDEGNVIASSDQIYGVYEGSGLVAGYTGKNFGLELRRLSYFIKDKPENTSNVPTDVTENTVNLVGRLGNDLIAMRTSLGFGDGTSTVRGESNAINYAVLVKGLGVDLQLNKNSNIKVFLDYYVTSFKGDSFNAGVDYFNAKYTHDMIFFGMSFGLGSKQRTHSHPNPNPAITP